MEPLKKKRKEQDFSQTSYLSYKPSAPGPLGCARCGLGTHAKWAPPPQTQARTDVRSGNSPVPVHPSLPPRRADSCSVLSSHALVHRSCVTAAVAATCCLSAQKGQMSVFRNNKGACFVHLLFKEISDLNTNETKCLEGRGHSEARRNKLCSRNLYLPLILKE